LVNFNLINNKNLFLKFFQKNKNIKKKWSSVVIYNI
jgi:hypothetical protein